jgi:hypothetical protein
VKAARAAAAVLVGAVAGEELHQIGVGALLAGATTHIGSGRLVALLFVVGVRRGIGPNDAGGGFSEGFSGRR